MISATGVIAHWTLDLLFFALGIALGYLLWGLS